MRYLKTGIQHLVLLVKFIIYKYRFYFSSGADIVFCQKKMNKITYMRVIWICCRIKDLPDCASYTVFFSFSFRFSYINCLLIWLVVSFLLPSFFFLSSIMQIFRQRDLSLLRLLLLVVIIKMINMYIDARVWHNTTDHDDKVVAHDYCKRQEWIVIKEREFRRFLFFRSYHVRWAVKRKQQKKKRIDPTCSFSSSFRSPFRTMFFLLRIFLFNSWIFLINGKTIRIKYWSICFSHWDLLLYVHRSEYSGRKSYECIIWQGISI